ncbi:predicted protein [Sclerotinia sclerotiorum 1980 UF-70]|uniref:Uncharacterized protein n=1 Tax=Sclerotinia sclerotiorum (strain ATCC 18683 / 1980 / Ss-1) TaxID=665079 RepID=A7EZA2_SCLS1|nr:predicted protein [Sclerotinia sclerotiorum 1980 UF-70]EDN94794.1 predicted protein [Sclerotinia sclerotiorum 1980 UF-70]
MTSQTSPSMLASNLDIFTAHILNAALLSRDLDRTEDRPRIFREFYTPVLAGVGQTAPDNLA